MLDIPSIVILSPLTSLWLVGTTLQLIVVVSHGGGVYDVDRGNRKRYMVKRSNG